ncbi:MAG: hypothetical protein KC912_25680 [Proteobacteria bacterium]|nr:hypothetical protein [Pseudomonadota bacterium]
MKRGQAALQLGTWMGVFPTGVETQLFVGAEVPVSERLTPFAYGGVHRHADGQIDARDTNIGVGWMAVTQPKLTVRLRPGLSLPTGALSNGFLFTPLSTSSVDPWLAVDTMYGSTWLVGGTIVARVPLMKGWDKIHQGPFARLDLRASRRIGIAVPWIGVSGVHQSRSIPEGASPSFQEVAAAAGAVFSPLDRWSFTVQTRVPLVVSTGTARQLTGGVSARWVVGKKPEDEDEHH